jgi:zinc transport system substrate-binding protein
MRASAERKTFGLQMKIIFIIVGVLAIGGTIMATGGCNQADSSGKMKVSASIVPLADFCKEVGGDKVDVQTLVPPGAGCGHTFEPTAGDMEFLSQARVFVENGLGLESWATSVLKKVTRDGVINIVASDYIPRDMLLPTEDQDVLANAGPGESVYDPHVWLDPSLAVYEVQAIRDGFIQADPSNSSYYRDNADHYIEKLKALDSELMDELSVVGGKAFIATHPTWTYLAAHYGLVQAGAVEVLPGKEPSAREISELIDKVRATNVKAVLAEPQLSPKALEIIAADAGPGVRVSVVDPVGDPNNPEVGDYISLMRFNAGVLKVALQDIGEGGPK